MAASSGNTQKILFIINGVLTLLVGCALSGLHSLRSLLVGCALSGLHSLRSLLVGPRPIGLAFAPLITCWATPSRSCIRSAHYLLGHALSGLHSLRSLRLHCEI